VDNSKRVRPTATNCYAAVGKAVTNKGRGRTGQRNTSDPLSVRKRGQTSNGRKKQVESTRGRGRPQEADARGGDANKKKKSCFVGGKEGRAQGAFALKCKAPPLKNIAGGGGGGTETIHSESGDSRKRGKKVGGKIVEIPARKSAITNWFRRGNKTSVPMRGQ